MDRGGGASATLPAARLDGAFFAAFNATWLAFHGIIVAGCRWGCAGRCVAPHRKARVGLLDSPHPPPILHPYHSHTTPILQPYYTHTTAMGFRRLPCIAMSGHDPPPPKVVVSQTVTTPGGWGRSGNGRRSGEQIFFWNDCPRPSIRLPGHRFYHSWDHVRQHDDRAVQRVGSCRPAAD